MNNWYLNRLKTFSPQEFPYRIKQYLVKNIERLFYAGKKFEQISYHKTDRILNISTIECQNNYLSPINIFGKKIKPDTWENIDWHKDVFTGKSFPQTFSKNIDIKKEADLSAKVVWEVNRLQFLMEIAIKYKQTKDLTYLKHFIDLNKSWKVNNPYLIGVNWYSNIEVNLRLINWFLCWEALDADELYQINFSFKQFVDNDWIPLIYSHCFYSKNNPSKYSSANNHLISEYAGLFIAASKWKFSESSQWKKYAKAGLEKEIIKQHSNGVNREEAAEYIQFITDFFLLTLIVAENTKNSFSEAYKNTLFKILTYINDFLDIKGNFPKYGDEDDGKCFIIDFDESFNNFNSLLISGAIIYKDPKFKLKNLEIDKKNLFLFGKEGQQTYQSISASEISTAKKTKFYKEEGHFIFRNNINKEVYMHFDAAPLGFLSIAAHGHSDALSFILHVDGLPAFIDSGTYTYHTEPIWRHYFMGTLAHNTIRINKTNQATIGGPTLWLKHYKTKILNTESTPERDRVKAMHTGYTNLGITHTREIIFEKDNNTFIITDNILSKSKDNYLIEMPFHLHPSIHLEKSNNDEFILTNDSGTRINLQIDRNLKTECQRGQKEPEIIGWYSNSFMEKQSCLTIMGSMNCSGNINLISKIIIN